MKILTYWLDIEKNHFTSFPISQHQSVACKISVKIIPGNLIFICEKTFLWTVWYSVIAGIINMS